MESETSLAMRPPTTIVSRPSLTPDIWNMINTIAPTIHRSRLFGVASPEGAAAIMLRGYELGLGLTTSFEYLVTIGGKPSLTPHGALAIALQSGELEGMKIEDRKGPDDQPSSCYVWMRRRNGLEYRLEYSMEDAKRAGLVRPNSAWQSYPANMLRWRCIGFVLDILMPDIIGGLKRADELGVAVDANGDVIEGQWAEATMPADSPSALTAPVTLNDLVDKYGAEAVMIANGGRIPGTDEEVVTVAVKLGGEK
jgi:hypothetical protein